jgi:hypothetical protein
MEASRIEIDRAELDRLRAIEEAARRFEKAGIMACQMNGEQWAAYIELKMRFANGTDALAKSLTRFQDAIIKAAQ